MRYFLPRTHRRSGQVMVEAIMPIAILLPLMLFSILLSFAYLNALLAEHAKTQTALYVGSTGTWTQAVKNRCEYLLPEYSSLEPVECRAYAETTPGSGNYTLIATPSCGNVSAVRDCPNEPGNYSLDYGGRIRVELTYSQPWLQICIPFVDDGCVGPPAQITRSVVVTSQTRRVDG